MDIDTYIAELTPERAYADMMKLLVSLPPVYLRENGWLSASKQMRNQFRRELLDSIGLSTGQMSPSVNKLINQIIERDQLGFKQFGGPIDDRKLSALEWLEEAIEENIDMNVYLVRAIAELKEELTD